MQIRVWKYLDNNSKQLIDLITSENIDYMKEMFNELKDLYNYWNYEVEKRGFWYENNPKRVCII